MKTAKRIVFTLLTVLLLIFIFGNSAADGDDSSSLSLRVTEWLNASLSALSIPLELSHAFVRKLAHFTEFSALGFLLTMTVWSWQKEAESWRFCKVWISLAGGLAAACIDEYLQTFVPERHGCIADALLDFSGVLWAALAAAAIIAAVSRKKRTE